MKRINKNPDLDTFIGSTICRLRKIRSLTQQELSDKAGVTQAYISLIEKGKASSGVTLDVLSRISHALGYKMSYLIEEAETHQERFNEILE